MTPYDMTYTIYDRFETIFAMKTSPHIEKLILCILLVHEGEAKQQNDWIKLACCSQSSFLRTTAELVEKGMIRKEIVDKLYRYPICF